MGFIIGLLVLAETHRWVQFALYGFGVVLDIAGFVEIVY